MDEVEEEVLTSYAFPAPHRVKLHSTHTLERRNKAVKRRANGVGVFPYEASILRRIGAVLMEQNGDWPLQHRSLPQHTMTDSSTEVISTMPRAA